ncbi:hypothetical protein LTR84_000185 [Exophiala bonariae]|uniref:Cytochrome P450 n=1 Tax=Exophiala bonariae TaxID=1690606 RepID=A0AAV9NSM5_9EURO|nr:hypothetical protein LTR84_000185 [Exophiala bonariae]
MEPQYIALLLLTSCFYFLYRLMPSLQEPTRAVPGPFVARFSSLWYFSRLYSGQFHDENVELHEKWGNIVRLAPNMYSIDDPEATKILYGPGTRFWKSDWYSVWGSPAIASVNLFALQDTKVHASVRRQYASYFAMSSVVGYEDYIDNVTDVFCAKLEEYAAAATVIDFGHWLQCYAFDVIAKITFGERFGFLDAGHDIGSIMSNLESFGLYSTLTGVYPCIHRLISRLNPKQANNYLVDFTVSKLEARRIAFEQGKPLPDTLDFCTKFAVANEKSPETFSPLHVIVGAGSNIAAGSETTSIALSSILANLLNSPTVLQKVRQEIKNARDKGAVSRPITFAQAQGLKYLQAVVKEGMRLHPSAALPLWRNVPEGGATIAGQYFRAGTVVGINPWVAHRNQSIFGPDAKSFRPERWLEASSEQAAAMERYWIPFGMGARTCIGKNISFLEISKLLPELVQRFDLEQVEPQEMKNINRWFVKQKNFKVRFKARDDF